MFLDGEISDQQIGEVSAHLADCYDCGSRAEFERHLRDIVRRYACDEVAPEHLIQKVRERCRDTQPAADAADFALEGG